MSASMFKDLPKSRILKQIARLNLIAGTPQTAYKLGPEIKKLELILILKNVFKPAAGLKHFWRKNLPVLKFHNEHVDFVATRVRAHTKEEVAKVPSKIIVHGTDGSKKDIDCIFSSHSDILAKVVEATKAIPVEAAEIPVLAVPKAHLQ